MARLVRAALHPRSSGRYLLAYVAQHPGLPVGATARMRRLIRGALSSADRVLVIGPVAAVRQALPAASLDVVGVSPYDPAVSIVSEASAAGSLPRRWSCVVVSELDASAGRLEAAAGACLPGGVVAVLRRPDVPACVPGAYLESERSSGDLRLVLTRMPP